MLDDAINFAMSATANSIKAATHHTPYNESINRDKVRDSSITRCDSLTAQCKVLEARLVICVAGRVGGYTVTPRFV